MNIQAMMKQAQQMQERLKQQMADLRVEATAVSAPEKAAGQDAVETSKSDLREKALADDGVKALLEVFPAEIRDVEEM